MLRLNGISAGYMEDAVVHGISIDVKPGRIACVIGANGAGKTTTLKSVVGLTILMGGTVELHGKNISNPDPVRLLTLGVAMVPEGRGVLSGLTVQENLLIGAHTVRPKQEVMERLDDVYTRFPRLQERAALSAGLLSGGEQQMLAIGRALMSRPSYVLLDEPTMGLSPLLVQFVGQLITELAATGIGILLGEQNAQMALGVADHGYVIEQGEITLSGPVDTLRKNPAVRTAYLGWES